jgi:D-threonate/D-erythronate kinase
MTEILIVADDLSGAADCASTCLSAGEAPLVLIDPKADCGDATALAIDVDSRAMPPQEAGSAMAAAVAHFLRPDTRILYQKMDSTLRGNWARETACALQAAAAIRGRQPLAIVAPAFPAAGRTMVGGLGFLYGGALKETETWKREGLTRPAEPAAWLATEGLRVTLAGIDEVRLGPYRLAAFFAERSAAGADAVLCDAETEADLDAIAGAALALAPIPLCVGSAGLMRALATAGGRRAASPAPPLPVTTGGPVLVVVGSASEVSRGQVQALVEERAVSAIMVTPSTLRGGTASGGLLAHAERIDASLASGTDLAISVAGSEGVDLREGRQISASLADLVAPQLHRFGGLVATGGETARAVLTRSGASGLRIRGEVEPGVPVSSALGAVGLPVITKAGAFGDRMTLIRCLDAIRGRSVGS